MRDEDEAKVSAFLDEAVRQRGAGDALQRAVFLVSELEVLCDMEGIDSFWERYGADGARAVAWLLREAGASSLAATLQSIGEHSGAPAERLLSRANDMVTARLGYDFASLSEAVARLMKVGPARG